MRKKKQVAKNKFSKEERRKKSLCKVALSVARAKSVV